MANWCINWVRVDLNNEAKDFERFHQFLTVFEERAAFRDKLGYGARLFDDYLFYMEMDDQDDIFIQGQYSTKWGPVETSTLQKLVDAFECIEHIDISFEESGCAVYGKQTFSKGGRVKTEEAPEYFVWACTLRDCSDNGYHDYTHATHETGLTQEQIEKVESKTGIALKDFCWEMEGFDIDDFM